MNEENILYIADANKTKPRKADDNLTNEVESDINLII